MDRLKKFFTEIYRSCTDFSLYKELFQRKYGTDMRYFLGFVTVYVLVVTIVIGFGLKTAIRELLVTAETTVPDFEVSIDNGELTTNLEEPYFIEDIAVIDTTGQFTSLDQTDAQILITRNEILYRQNEFETRSFSLSEVDNVQFTKQQALDLAHTYDGRVNVLLLFLIFISCWIGIFAWYLLYNLFFSLLALIFAQGRYTFGQAQQVGFHALTLPIIGTSVWALFGTVPRFVFTIVFLIFFVKGLQLTPKKGGKKKAKK